MTPRKHAVVWIDHHEALIIFFDAVSAEEEVIHPEDRTFHIHTKAGSRFGTQAKDEPDYCQAVCDELEGAQEIWIVGPSAAKTELVRHMSQKVPHLYARLAGVEPMEKVTDRQLVAAARKHFRAFDRMRPVARV